VQSAPGQATKAAARASSPRRSGLATRQPMREPVDVAEEGVGSTAQLFRPASTDLWIRGRSHVMAEEVTNEIASENASAMPTSRDTTPGRSRTRCGRRCLFAGGVLISCRDSPRRLSATQDTEILTPRCCSSNHRWLYAESLMHGFAVSASFAQVVAGQERAHRKFVESALGTQRQPPRFRSGGDARPSEAAIGASRTRRSRPTTARTELDRLGAAVRGSFRPRHATPRGRAAWPNWRPCRRPARYRGPGAAASNAAALNG
jgi:hypothetical protein